MDACVVVGITLEAPLAAASVDGGTAVDASDPFSSVYRDFAIWHTATGNAVDKRAGPGSIFTPASARKTKVIIEEFSVGHPKEASEKMPFSMFQTF